MMETTIPRLEFSQLLLDRFVSGICIILIQSVKMTVSITMVLILKAL